ncbi:SRPBCC family protein [Novosphingobium flavum]|uniref:SRPBCC family protein n=2 Tax=Novosphingobium flavum TaxID=1778672 RepID=A0A7X1KLP0_9SPHN|nr:SRPBCC family protein [Novosphingobium flavum]
MDLKFTVFGRIARPVAEVYEAVADPAQLSAYFTTGGARGRIETGATVTWDFADFPGAFPVEVVEAHAGERIVLRWQAREAAGSEGKSTVTFSFMPTDDGRTLVEISEGAWQESQAGLDASYGNCMGWSQMLCALKMWLEHGVNLREGMYV